MKNQKQSVRYVLPTKRRRRSPQLAEEAILKAAETTALNLDGRFTLVHVAKVVGISPSSIYEHFGSKAALLAALTERAKKRQVSL